MTKQRGLWVERKGFYLMGSYHPSALLRDESGQYKRQAWEDLKSLRAKLEELERG